MKSTVLWALMGLNAVLLCMFVMQFGHSSSAFGQAARRPPDYVLMPMGIVGQPTDLICVIDTTNGILGGLAYDDSAKKIQALPGPIGLDQVFSAPAITKAWLG